MSKENVNQANKSNAKVRTMELAVDTEELKYPHIMQLSPAKAKDLLTRVARAREQLLALRGPMRYCEETRVLLAKLHAAERDLKQRLEGD